MATKRQTKKASGRKRKEARRSTGARQRRPARRRARAGARQARREEAARAIHSAGPRLVPAHPAGTSSAPERDERWSEGPSGVPSFARAAAGDEGGPDGGATAATGREPIGRETGDGATAGGAARAAGDELARWREEAEAARRRADQDLPGFGAIGMEIAVGALRLARTLLTAPLRIGLAFLSPRDA
jgi:hypothetical protein